MAIGPAFIREASVIGTETLYTTLLVAGIVIAMERPSARRAALSGALIGLASLTRMPPLLLPPALAALWLIQERRRWRAVLGPILALLLGFVAVLALWALYTALAWGRPILVSDTSIGAVAFRGALGGGGYQEIDDRVQELTGAEASEEHALPYEAAVWEVIREDPFGYLLGRAEALLGATLQPHGTLYFSGPSLKAMLAEWWRDGRSFSGLTAITRAPGFGGKALLWAFHLVALAGGLVGGWRFFAGAKNRPALAVVLLALLYTYGLHFWLDANARYLFPNEPLWWLLAGAGLELVAPAEIRNDTSRKPMSKFLFALLVALVSVGVATAQDVPSVQDVCENWGQNFFLTFEERQVRNRMCDSAVDVQEVCETWKEYLDPIPGEQQAYDTACNRPQPTPTPEPTPTPMPPGISDKFQNWWKSDRDLNELWGIFITPWTITDAPPFVFRAPAIVIVVAGLALALASVVILALSMKYYRKIKALQRVESELKEVNSYMKKLEGERGELIHKVKELEKGKGERDELRRKVKALEKIEIELKGARLRMGMLESERKEIRSPRKVQVSVRESSQRKIIDQENKSKNHSTVGWDALRIYYNSRGELQAHGNYKGYPKNWSEISARLRREHPRCSNCNFRKEQGVPLQVHHINGVPADCRAENLQVLCEICHKRMHGRSPFAPWKRLQRSTQHWNRDRTTLD